MMPVFSHSRVTPVTTVRRFRRLPPGAIPTVSLSQMVKALDVVAAAETPGVFRVIKLAEALHTKPTVAETCLVKRQGDHVDKGEVLAVRRLTFGLRSLQVTAPIEGWLVRVDGSQVIIEGERKRQEVFASMPGKVIGLEAGQHIIIEGNGALIQIAWGHGGLAWGTLKVLDTTPGLTSDPKRFNIDHRGAIVATGAPVTQEFLEAATEIRVKGLIAASMRSSLLPLVSKLEFPLGLTQGFGELPMSENILRVLNNFNGREIALDMSLSPDWRETRPEIIIPVSGQGAPEDRSADRYSFKVGQKARILQPPQRGEIGTIVALPVELRQLESGLWMPGAQVQIPGGETIFVPFANLEHLG